MLATLIDSLAIVALSAATMTAQTDTLEGVHYVVYRADGTPAHFADIVASARDADALLIGETHDDPIAHALEFQLLEAMHGAVREGRPVALSLEMFESDVQMIIDEYLADFISEAHFKRSVRPWGNYDGDYRPSVEFARENALRVIAANAPRRYVSRVTSFGSESLMTLPTSAKVFLPPLPYESASVAYKEQWNALMAKSMAEMQAAMDSVKLAEQAEDETEPESAEDDSVGQAPPLHGSSGGMNNALDSQSLWDASMAYSIARELMNAPGSLVVHFAGGFHVETGTGIPEHLERYRPGTRRIIVAIRPHDSIHEFDHDEFAGLGDFVILTDKAQPRTLR
jgi:uncharacterized iron-regulated protein